MGGSQQQRDKKYENHPYAVFLRKRMWLMGLDLTTVQRATGLSMATLSFLTNGNQQPRTISNPTHEVLANALRVPMRVLIELSGYDLERYSDEDLSEALRQANAAAIADAQFYLKGGGDVPMG